MFDILQLGAYCASHADVSNVLQVGRIIFTGDLETNNNICMARTYHRINIDCEIILIYGPLKLSVGQHARHDVGFISPRQTADR